jgi:hydroxymethylbilane synthase
VHDVFITNPKKSHQTFAGIPPNSIIATGSLRRKCQLLNARPDIQIVEIRGNLNTRMKKLDSSEWDGMILAKAGVTRLGWARRITDILPLELMLPAVGQGALAIESRIGDQRVQEMVRPLHHHATAAAVTAERALLRYLEGGCQIPIGAYGQINGNELRLNAVIGSLDGKRIVQGNKVGTIADAEQTGIDLAKELFHRGGKEILEEIRQTFRAIPS